MKTVYETVKVFHSTLEDTVKSHPCLANEWLHKHKTTTMPSSGGYRCTLLTDIFYRNPMFGK